MTAYPRRTVPFDLFPPLSPYSSGFLDVDHHHHLYWEQSGNPDGVPILHIHGGPGAGATAKHRRFFDPDHYRIIIFDQRGAGRSQPLGSLHNNTREHLLSDMEVLREHLRVGRWHLFGGSWGSTLALSYAQKHPQRCISLILRGISLLEQDEINWFIYGMRRIFPEAWEQFASLAPKQEQNNLLEFYYKILSSDDRQAATEAAVNWSLYEGACLSLIPNYETITSDEQKDVAWAIARIEAHYYRNNAIPAEQSLLRGIDRIRSIPATIIQGRYDMVSPIVTAHRLHQAWPEADYIIVPDGGHASMDPPVRARLIEATENAKTIR
ncbi:MAG: prolyl aminopeptidase [Alphaproteobacteria bacterium]|nr:prolyl aminopeptidase [Alphaproteobacteria bacterium]